MCLVIDVNCLSRVFDTANAEHEDFVPVRHWIMDGDGKVVYGGSRFKKELKSMRRYLELLGQLAKVRKVCLVDDALVDGECERICALCGDGDFDDPHIVAIVCASGCRIVCTKDERAIQYLKRSDFYPKGTGRPRIYSQIGNRDLLNRKELWQKCCT